MLSLHKRWYLCFQFSKSSKKNDVTSSRQNGKYPSDLKRHLTANSNSNFGANFRLDGSEEDNSRKSSSARSSVESRPLVVDNDDETYSFIMEDQPPLPPAPPPPPPFSSLPVSGHYLRKVGIIFLTKWGWVETNPSNICNIRI